MMQITGLPIGMNLKGSNKSSGFRFRLKNKYVIGAAALLMLVINLTAITIIKQKPPRRRFVPTTSSSKAIIPSITSRKNLQINQKRMNISHKPTCALLFFGLPKHFRRTVFPSIKSNILQYNSHCDIYLHTYDLNILPKNERNYEPSAKLKSREVFDMTNNVTLGTEENFQKSRNLTYYRQYFPYVKKSWVYPQSLDNMIKQWHSIDTVWKYMERSVEKSRSSTTQKPYYQRVGLFRSDLIYDNPIDIFQGGDAVTPDFGLINSTRELNDRFFFGTYEFAKVWADRFTPVSTYMKSSSLGKDIGLHSETYLHYIMKEINITRAPICARRVRVTGKAEHDCWCDQKAIPKVCSWWLDYLQNHGISYPEDWE